jgi:hypothetical protein
VAVNAPSSNRTGGAPPPRVPVPDVNTLRRWVRLHTAAIVWTALAAPIALLGLWGFLEIQVPAPLGPPQQLTPLDACYRTLRLFTLSMDLPPDARPPPQLWFAAFAAPVLTLGGILELFGNQLRSLLTSYVIRPKVVVFGANERAAALITAQGHVSKWRNGVVVVDPDPQRLTTMADIGAWTVRGDGISRVSLRRCAVTGSAGCRCAAARSDGRQVP